MLYCTLRVQYTSNTGSTRCNCSCQFCIHSCPGGTTPVLQVDMVLSGEYSTPSTRYLHLALGDSRLRPVRGNRNRPRDISNAPFLV